MHLDKYNKNAIQQNKNAENTIKTQDFPVDAAKYSHSNQMIIKSLLTVHSRNHKSNQSQEQNKNIKATITTFKVHEDPILSAPWLALPHNDCRQHLLPEIRLPFLDSGHHHVTNTSRW